MTPTKNGNQRGTGNRGKGRKKGVPNKATASVKQAIIDAFEQHGGVPALVKWAKSNETEFYKLWSRLAPTEIAGTGTNGEIIVRFVKDERVK